MKAIFTWLLTAMMLTITLSSEAQSWQWGKRGGSTGGEGQADAVIDMATDQNGNVYVVARNNKYGPTNVDGHTGIGPQDRISVASWSCNGEFRWMKTFGSSSGASAVALRTDTLGGVYITGAMTSITGSFGGLGYFDTDSLLPGIYKTMYVIKYDTLGTFQWLKMPQPDTFSVTSGNYSGAFDMDASLNGDLYLYALLTPGLYDGGAFTVADTGMYVWKMNKDGVFQSLAKLDVTVSGTPFNNYGYANFRYSHFKRDHQSGRYYLGGWYFPDFGNLTIGTTAITSAPSIPVIYLAAFSSVGDALWAKQADTFSAIDAITVGTDGNVYASGGAVPGVTFNGNTFINSMGIPQVAFVVATDSMGNNLWATNNSSSAAVADNGDIVYANNTVTTTGKYAGPTEWQGHNISSPPGKSFIYLARFNAITGAILGLDSLATGGLNNFGLAITADKNGNLFVGGSFDASITVAGNTLYKTGGPYDWFVAKYGSANCNCTIPTAGFTFTTSGSTASFSYTGSTDYTSISWDFGDGTTAATANPSHTFTDTASHTVCVTVTNDCGSNLYCLEVAGATGIGSTSSAAAVKVYPNPTASSIMVEGAGSGTKLSLFSITGALQLEQTLRSSLPVSLNISHLPDGIYLLQFTDSMGRKGMTKVVKR